MVFQHGETPGEIRKAHQWAITAVELDPKNDKARWLAAASEDRILMYEKKPQRYGTQFTADPVSGKWELYTVDETVTDEERAKWNVPSLEAARQRATDMNAKKSGAH
jgi:hypothetical protein